MECNADTLLTALQGGRALGCVQRHRLAALNHNTVLVRTEESSVLKRSNHVCVHLIHVYITAYCVTSQEPLERKTTRGENEPTYL